MPTCFGQVHRELVWGCLPAIWQSCPNSNPSLVGHFEVGAHRQDNQAKKLSRDNNLILAPQFWWRGRQLKFFDDIKQR